MIPQLQPGTRVRIHPRTLEMPPCPLCGATSEEEAETEAALGTPLVQEGQIATVLRKASLIECAVCEGAYPAEGYYVVEREETRCGLPYTWLEPFEEGCSPQQDPDTQERFAAFVRQRPPDGDQWVHDTLLSLVNAGELIVGQDLDGEFNFKPTGR